MRILTILGLFIPLFSTACQAPCRSADDGMADDWPRISLDTRLLIVDDTFLEMFLEDCAPWDHDPKSFPTALYDELTAELIISATNRTRFATYMMAPRVSFKTHEVGRILFDTGQHLATVSRNPVKRAALYNAVLQIDCLTKSLTVPSGLINLALDMQLIPEDLHQQNIKADYSGAIRLIRSDEGKEGDQANDTGPPHVKYLLSAAPWPTLRGEFSVPDDSYLLVALPNDVTRHAVSDPKQKDYHLLLLIHAVVLHTPEDEQRLYPGLEEDAAQSNEFDVLSTH